VVSPVDEAIGRWLAGFPGRTDFLVGVSGGRDSMVLLDAMVRGGFSRLVVCHLNHGLRGRESAGDAAFVRRRAKALGLGFESAKADTRGYAAESGKSLELAARELRHVFFSECAVRRRCRRIVLAHHADDQVETCLHHFLRGTGAAGLAGMRGVARVGGLTIFRPLLGVRRADIDAQAVRLGIVHREDGSNSDRVHTRNALRHDVLPAIERAVGKSFYGAILRTAAILRQEDEWLESCVPELPGRIPCRVLRELPEALRARAVHRWLGRRGVSEPGFAETQRVLSLLDPDDGPAKVNLPGNLHARRRAGLIFLERGKR
jgi:tRNA(Ile)-lysidine synthase